ncbi:hypothetical protein FKM82_027507 [Ascaphus truei]
MTEALRESHVKEKLERYPKVVLRILFPDRYVLQGFFRPTERVGAVREFVRSHLSDPELPFYLFITPPRTELTENSQTLFQVIHLFYPPPPLRLSFLRVPHLALAARSTAMPDWPVRMLLCTLEL